MKRVFMYASALTLVFGMSLAVTSCSGNKTDANAEAADSTKTEQTVAPQEETTVTEEVTPVDSTAAVATDSTAEVAADTTAEVAE